MIKKALLLPWLLFVLYSCEKTDSNNNDDNQYPKEVTFEYNNETVTYGVVKRDYKIDANGVILNDPISKLWLDRNLGAKRIAQFKYDSLAFGDLFQWGRLADGHQIRNSDTTHELSESIVPGHNKFIAKPLNSNDWLISSNDSLWSDMNNTNCPCPEGWRVPSIEELRMEMNSWDTLNMEGAYNSLMKWSAGGMRDNNGIVRYEYWAFIWSSTSSNNNWAESIAIIGDDLAEKSSSTRITGLAVRCIKDY